MSDASYQFYFAGDDYFRDLIRTIGGAKRQLCLETYIFEMDSIGLHVLDHMARSAGRGVSVYLLVDGMGSYHSLGPLRQFCRRSSIHFRAYHAIPRFAPWNPRFWARIRLLFSRAFWSLNSRNHRKVLIADGERVLLGSFNISAVHSEQLSGEKAWRDTAIGFQDRNLAFPLEEAFFAAWRRANLFRRARLHRPRLPSAGPIRLNDRFRQRLALARDLYHRVSRARSRIWITNAYFVPRRRFLAALLKAARRPGVEVALCLPAQSDVWIVREASRSLYRRLLLGGVKIYEYQPAMMHAKTMVIDDWAVVGSHNLNHRSFIHDLEAEISLEGDRIQPLVDQWECDLANSRPVTFEDLDGDSLWRMMISRLCYVFRYWL